MACSLVEEVVNALAGGQVESLWDEVLPGEVKELPEDVASLDVLLSDPVLLEPIVSGWQRDARAHGRPTISMATYVRLMVIKQRTGWGYETLMREVSDSIHLRRFCLIALGERVPDESTVRKLTRRLGGEVVNELTRCVIAKAQRETRFRARAVRIDSTVVEADVRLSERCWADAGWRQNAGARGQEADGGGRGGRRTSAGSHARNRAPSANDLQDDGQKDRRAQVGGPAADRGGRSTAPAVAAGSETSGWQGAPRRAGSWREREARCGQATARDDRPSRASRFQTGSSRYSTRTLVRSARASWASPTCADSATIPR